MSCSFVLDVNSTFAIAAILANASPLKPIDVTVSKSSADLILLVACLSNAISKSSWAIPFPSSVIFIYEIPPFFISTVILVAPASIEFSIISFITDAGLSITSPAAILFIVAYNMCQWRPFVRLVKTAPKSDIAVLVITFMLTVVFDLVVAIEVGMVLACLLFMKRMSDETHVDSWTYVDDDTPDVDAHLKKLPLQIRVYEITGPLFFGAADAIEHIVVKDFTTCLVLRMRSVPAIDSTAMNALFNLTKVCENKGITLVFSHVNEQPMKVMEKAGFVELVGRKNFCPNISAALAHAEEISI